MKSQFTISPLSIGLLLAVSIFTFPGASQLWAQPPVAAAEDSVEQRPWYELGMMVDPIADQTLLFYLAMTYSGQADIGECLETAARIDTADPDSWPEEWVKTADRVVGLAETAEVDGHEISAGQRYMRAATYYSAALHRHNDPTDPQIKTITEASVACFKKALELLDIPATTVEVPYEGTTLPGYFFRSSRTNGLAPVIIVHQGRDGWAEHCKYIADAAIKRGYHCLLIDGPGQGKVLRTQGLPFRPDWENVITPVVDYLVKQPGVDSSRIALMGLSMGGSLAPRVAAFEKRLKVCIANPGVFSWPDIVSGFLGQIDPSLTTLWETNPTAFDTRIQELSSQIPVIDWGIRDMMWKHGSNSPSRLMADLQEYSNEDIVSRITCRMLVMDGTADDFSQGELLYESLSCHKSYMLFAADDTGLQHCQVGAQAFSSEQVFDWLDENL